MLIGLKPTARLCNLRSGIEYDRASIKTHVHKLAHYLALNGIDHGDRVVLADPDPLYYVLAIFACWQVGATAVSVNPSLSEDEKQTVLKTTKARLWLGGHESDWTQTLQEASLKKTDAYRAQVPLTWDEPALVLMTSGTTGVPKGITHSIRNLYARAALNQYFIGREVLQRTLCVLPVFFGHGLIGNVLTPLWSGGSVHLWSQPAMTEIRELGKIIDTHEVTFMSSVPSFWRIALRVADQAQKSMKRVHIGSAPLSIALWRDIAEWNGTRTVFNMYGMTETANWIGGGALHSDKVTDGYVGPIWGGQLAVLDDSGCVETTGQGEVLVQSPTIMLNYLDRPDLQDDSFHYGWFRTGDIGAIDVDGDLVLMGRQKSEINRGGIKIQAEEIDMLLERHPDIVEACAFGLDDQISGEAVAAAIVLRQDASVSIDEIRIWCSQHARPDAVPTQLFVLEAIPKNDRGKIVRNQVRMSVLLKKP